MSDEIEFDDGTDPIDGGLRSVQLPRGVAGERLDKALTLVLPDLSRSRIKALILAGMISDERGVVLSDPAFKPDVEAELQVTVPEAIPATPEPEDIPLNILFEDEDLIVLDKPAGMVVHPAAGHASGTLVNALLHHCRGQLSGIGGVARPGIVHRLDKDTSGVMVVAKSDQAHRGLSDQFREHNLERSYLALVWGCPEPRSGRVDTQIGRSSKNRKAMAVLPSGGKHAITNYKLIQPVGLSASLVECRLETGRTHQIRVHMTYLGHPVIGDPVYGGQRRRSKRLTIQQAKAVKTFPRQALHANVIGFFHPLTGEFHRYISKLPNDINDLIDIL